MRFRFYNILVAIFVTMGSLYAQTYDIKRYSVNEGLPAGQVYDVEFTADGYAWFGTTYGIVKTDGISFETFGEEHGLKNEIINDLLVDNKGSLLIAGNADGVSKFHPDSIIYPKEFHFLEGKDVSTIKQTETGVYWFGTTSSGVFIWNPNKGHLDSLNTNNSEIRSNTVWDIFISNKKEFWISTYEGVFVFDRSLNLLRYFNTENGLSGVIAYHVFQSREGEYWVSTSNGITVINGGDYSTKHIFEIAGQKLNYVYNINQDDDGLIWVATERDGLFWYSEDIQKNIRKENGLSSNFLYRLVKDAKGTIWIASDGDGVNIIKDKRFRIFDGRSDYGSDETYGVHKHSDGTLYFANEDGLTSYKNDVFKKFKFQKEYPGIQVWDMEELPNGNLLLLSYEYSLFEFDGSEIREYSLPGGRRPYYKSDLLINQKNEIVLSGEYGIQIIKGSEVDSIKVQDEYWASYVNIMFQDSDGIYWLGTEKGILEVRDKNITRYSKEEGVFGDGVYEIKEDALGNIWFGTNKGITVFVKSGDRQNRYKITSYTLGEEVVSETMFLQFDGAGGVWHGTNAGLNYINLHLWDADSTAITIHYSLADYGRGIEFNGSSVLEDDEGNLWFGTARKGVVKFSYSNELKKIEVDEAPVPFFKSINTDQEIQFKGSEVYEFEYDNNTMEFSVGAFNFKDPERVTFRYKLEGFDTELSQVTSDRSKRYTNLPPGKYTFQVYSKSPTSAFSTRPASFSFKIMAPFWNRWWFWTLIISAIIVLSFVLIKARLEFLEKNKLSVLVKERTKELEAALVEKEVLIKEIHHRVKNNLAVISGLLELQSWNLKSDEALNALKDSKLRISAIAKIHENLYQNEDLAKIDFNSFLKDLLSGITAANDFSNKLIEIDQQVQSNHITVNIAIPCGLIINELVTNCYKHAFPEQNTGKIEVSFEERGEIYKLIVSDNGKGIDLTKTQTHKSLGMTLVNSLSEQLSASKEVTTKSGTQFLFEIPKAKTF